jgi:TolB-like protein/Tfp pilus assembly protein PilF
MSEDANHNAPPQAEDRLLLLWRRVNQHKLVQWSVAYVALAYGIQHGVTLTSEAFEWPHAVERVSMLLLVLGLPVVMTLAWYHGARASRHFSHAELSILSALLVIGVFLFYSFAQPSEQIASNPAAQQASLAPASPASLHANGIAIAVLPFANVSADAAQEFFSDGMTDEISGALAKVQNLRVIGRSSAFQFKGQNQDVRMIGQALGASHLIEGSVRQASGRVRISAQLVRTTDGVQLWSENYDRELKDIFATQEDIAEAIVGALRVPLGLQRGERLVSNRTTNLESYSEYLKARALLRARSADEARAVLEPVVERDPGYAPAWALLARAYNLGMTYNAARVRTGPISEQRRIQLENLEKQEGLLREAIRLDPKNSLAITGMAVLENRRRNRAAGADLFRQALALDSNEPETIDAYSQILAQGGYLKESLRLRDQLRTLEPFVPIYNITTAAIMRGTGQFEAAIKILESTSPNGVETNYIRNLELAEAYAALKQYGKAADFLLAIPADQNRAPRQSIVEAVRLLRTAPAKAAPGTLPTFLDEMNFVYAHVGAIERVLEYPERSVAIGSNAGVGDLWSTLYAPLRKTERFKALMRAQGFVDQWRERGWPDLCHPVGTDDFACD